MIKNKKAFTLIELLIAVSILGILSGVIIVLINPSRERAKANDVVLKRALSSIASSIEVYRSSQGSYPSTANLLLPYLTGGFTSNSNGFVNSSISVGGVKGGTITYRYSASPLLLCLDAQSNVDTAQYFRWIPGSGITTVAVGQKCSAL